MTPNRKIKYHSFLHGLGKLKFVDAEGNLMIKSPQHIEPGPLLIPMILEGEFRPRRGMMSRYAERVVNNSFYGIVEHDGAE